MKLNSLMGNWGDSFDVRIRANYGNYIQTLKDVLMPNWNDYPR
jgi:hypothetical protein